jgi:hypothetical protein
MTQDKTKRRLRDEEHREKRRLRDEKRYSGSFPFCRDCTFHCVWVLSFLLVLTTAAFVGLYFGNIEAAFVTWVDGSAPPARVVEKTTGSAFTETINLPR